MRLLFHSLARLSPAADVPRAAAYGILTGHVGQLPTDARGIRGAVSRGCGYENEAISNFVNIVSHPGRLGTAAADPGRPESLVLIELDPLDDRLLNAQ